MKRVSTLLLVASLIGAGSAPGAEAFRQHYLVAPAVAAVNRQRITADSEQAADAWKQAAVSYVELEKL